MATEDQPERHCVSGKQLADYLCHKATEDPVLTAGIVIGTILILAILLIPQNQHTKGGRPPIDWDM